MKSLILGSLFYKYKNKIEPMLIFEVNTLGKLSLKIILTGSSIMIVRKFLLNALKIWLQMAS